jgi:hypothetical protein
MIQLDASQVSQAMRAINRSMKTAEGGKLIKRKVSAKLRKVAKPLVDVQKERVLRLPSRGHAGPSMRQAIAKRTKASTRWGGKNAGISIVQRGTGMPRDFRLAGRAFNREEGWNPTNLAGETTHQQVRPAEWFDQPTKGMRPTIKHEMIQALEEAADTMARAAHRR